MQLAFEIIKNDIGVGNYPDIVHFANTQAQVFYLDNGELYGQPTNKIEYGEWDDVVFQEATDASPDTGMSNFEVKVLPGWGIVGGYKTGDIHKMIIYEFAWEMGEYLNSGSVKHSIDNPISSFTLNLENPDLKDPEHPGNVAINEGNSLLSPGAKVVFRFGSGEEEAEFDMGKFYVDRSNFTLLNETANVDGRNSIGKILKDQTLDEHNEYWYGIISDQISDLLENAKIEREKYSVEQISDSYGWFNFSPNIDYLKALNTMLELLQRWKIRELSNGTIIVGSENYTEFESSGIYLFNRNKDIFSRQITRDDDQAYNRVCVHTENYANVIYKDVKSYTGWNLQANKTLYIQVANGFKASDLESHADELVERLEGVGKLESFTGPFRPHLQVGDEAIIMDGNNQSLGLITEITHNFGKSGFYTNFTVDSGGTVGKGRLSDFISKIAIGSMSKSANVGWNDINLDDYVNLAKYSKVAASSGTSGIRTPDKLIDGDLGFDGWMPYSKDDNPFIVFNLGQRCLVDKIILHLGLNLEPPLEPQWLPEYYKIQYWNNAFWVDLLDLIGPDVEMTHEFTAVETSMIRIITTKATVTPTNPYSSQIWREVEIWGNM